MGVARVCGEGTLGRHAWGRRRFVHSFRPALAAALLTGTSVDGQRDPCIILPDPAAYFRVGDDLGDAKRLAVMAVDFGRWSQRTSVGLAPPCGGLAKQLRQRQSLQRELYAVDRQRLAVALRRLGLPGS